MFTTMPISGSYVTFSIDPVATLEYLQDGAVEEVTRQLSPKKYAGYVEGPLNWFDIDPRYMVFDIKLLGRGVPNPRVSAGFESLMCLPVLPNRWHPLSCKPLEPSQPLPWADFYHYSHVPSVRIRVPSPRAESSVAATISTGQSNGTCSLVSIDTRRQKHVELTRDSRKSIHTLIDVPFDNVRKVIPADKKPIEDDAQSPAATPCEIIGDSASTNHRKEHGGNAPQAALGYTPSIHTLRSFAYGQTRADSLSAFGYFHGGTDDLSVNISDEGDIEILGEFPEILTGPKVSDTIVVVNVSYELNSDEPPANPDEFFAEQAFLEKLADESRARASKIAKELIARSIERTRMLDAEDYQQNVSAGLLPDKSRSKPTWHGRSLSSYLRTVLRQAKPLGGIIFKAPRRFVDLLDNLKHRRRSKARRLV